MPVINIPDTIFDNPAFNDLNPTSLIPLGGRLMSSSPHVDGLLMGGAELISAFAAANPVKARNAKGDWSWNRTAAGAETPFYRVTIGQLLRLGELYNLGEFSAPGVQTNYPPAPAKGIAIVDFFVGYSVSVVGLTSATLRLGKTVYPKSATGVVAFAQTDLVAATAVTQLAATGSLAQYAYFDVGGPSSLTGPLVFSVDDLGLVEIEFAPVLANTGVLQVAYMGAHVQFNYN